MSSPSISAKSRARGSTLAPLAYPVFRRIWAASVASNLGLLIMGVGAAWSMTLMTSSPDMVALVQTALMAPVAVLSTPAGAAADMFDRRIVGLFALSTAFLGAALLTTLAIFDLLNPPLLLLFCFIVGAGNAIFGPSWQASVPEQVPPEALTAAVALNGISYNIARSFGPAVGGVIVASFGALAAYFLNALLYIPLIIVLAFWRRPVEPSRLPPERLIRAVVSGARYILNSPSVRVVLVRTFVSGLAGGAIFGLLPLVTRELLEGDARTYGLTLSAFGAGAVIGALNLQALRARLGVQEAVRFCLIVIAASVAVLGASRSLPLTLSALAFAGAAWTTSVTFFNVGVQLAAPRWVSGRALAGYQGAVSGGIALGSWGWGWAAKVVGLSPALYFAAAAFLLAALLGRWLRMPEVTSPNNQSGDMLEDPEVRLPLTPRSGPIVVEIEYRVELKRARMFYAVMQHVQSTRMRTGAYAWSIARDIADPELWIERFHCPTWHDYLRQRNRASDSERALFARADEFHIGPEPIRIHRMLERPIGSVRWKEETPDHVQDQTQPISTPGGD